MFCLMCGKQIDDNAKFCIFCGAPVADDAATGGTGAPEVNAQFVDSSCAPETKKAPDGETGFSPIKVAVVGEAPIVLENAPEAADGAFEDSAAVQASAAVFASRPIARDLGSPGVDANAYSTRAFAAPPLPGWQSSSGTQAFNAASAPPAGSVPGQSAVPRPQPVQENPDKSKTLVIILAAAAVLVVGLVVGAILLFGDSGENAITPGGASNYGYVASGSVPSDSVPYNDAGPQTTTTAPEEPVETVAAIGNTAANIINSGFAAEYGGYIYYRAGSGDLCRMNMDGSGRRMIRTADCYYINVYKNNIYYSDENDNFNLFRVSIEGGERKRLSYDECYFVFVVDDTIFYKNSADGKIYSTALDGAGRRCLVDHEISSFVVFNGFLYVLENDSHGSLYRYNFDGSGSTFLLYGTEKVTVLDGSVCFRYTPDGGKLYRLLNDYGEITCLCDDLCHFPNNSEKRLFYARYYEDNVLYHMAFETGDERRLSGKHCYNLNIVGSWIIYRNESDNYNIYMMGLDGKNNTKL